VSRSNHTARAAIITKTAAVFAALAPAAAWAADPLPVGIVAETTVLSVILRMAAVLWGAVLLVFGTRRPRSTLMSFYVVVALLVGLLVGGDTSYLLSIAITLMVLAAAAAAVVWVRRLAVALACVWPLVAFYVAQLYFSGSFERSLSLTIGLALTGVVFGGLLPRVGTALVAASVGTVLLLTGLPVSVSFSLIVVVAAGSFVGQTLVLHRLLLTEAGAERFTPMGERPRKRKFTETVRWGAAVVVALVLVVIFVAPQYGPGTGPHPYRLERLVTEDRITTPGLIISAGNNLYLSGRATPVAIVSERPGLLNRIILPFVGRSPSNAIRSLRAVKDPSELDTMRKSAAITSRAFTDIAPMIRPGVNEAEIEAAIIDSFRRNGANGIAFKSIVGSGPNAVLPHYEKNDATMEGGMVVIDIGCSVDGYASDMTRSFPVNGRLTPEEQELVDTVNAAGDAARAILRDGVTMRELNRAARDVIEEAGFGPYFLHGLGHHVGLNVHDPRVNELKSGMVITIEPGIYISKGSDVDPVYWDIGVRIEDSYIVTEDGYEEITHFPR